MSYNGIGLTTARGSGTNGYVQRNFAAVRRRERHGDRRVEKAFSADSLLHTTLTRAPNAELLAHSRKRAVEVQCVELEERMEAQGYTEEEVMEKVAEFRLQLLAKSEDDSRTADRK